MLLFCRSALRILLDLASLTCDPTPRSILSSAQCQNTSLLRSINSVAAFPHSSLGFSRQSFFARSFFLSFIVPAFLKQADTVSQLRGFFIFSLCFRLSLLSCLFDRLFAIVYFPASLTISTRCSHCLVLWMHFACHFHC